MAETVLRSERELRTHYGPPGALAVAKQMDRLDAHCRAFIAMSPMVVVASSDAQGRLDATPRGDAPGFVTVLDDRTLAIPDRKGNNRVDTLMNLVEHPRVGLLFLVPGVNESLRVNGTAEVTVDPALLAPLAAQGKTPAAAILVRVEEVYFHCGKAMIRSKLWDPAAAVERGRFPTLAKVLADQISGGDEGAYAERIETGYRNGLY